MDKALTFNPKWAFAPPIIQVIFENLPGKDLNSCSRVCSMWYTVANIVKKQRNSQISWYPVKTDNNNSQDCREAAFTDYIRNLRFEPRLALIFTLKTLCNCDNKHKNETYELLKHLPPSCKSLFCSSAEMVTQTPGSTLTPEAIKEEGIMALFFPDLPGAEVTIFKLSDMPANLNFSNDASHPGKPVRCLLGFHTGNALSCERGATGNLLQYHSEVKGHVIAAGIYNLCELKFQEQCCGSREQSFGVAFAGENVHANSVIVRAGAQTADSIEETLKLLFAEITLDGPCIVFAFTSIGNTQHISLCQKLESSVFRKLFPSVPLFHLFGYGAIGKSQQPNFFSPYENFNIFMNSYATIYVAISVKN